MATENEPLDIIADAEEEDHSELLRELKKWYREDSEHIGDWRDEAHEDYAFVANDQWAEEDRQALKEQLRPVITFNRIDPLIRSVQGEQINNAQVVNYLPREPGDAVPNELLTSAADWFRDLCDADDEESEAFWDTTICGVGVTETRLDTEDDPDEPRGIIERVDPFEMLWDCNAVKRNLSDARRCWRVRANIPIDEALESYPTLPSGEETTESDLDARWAHMAGLGKTDSQDEADRYEGSSDYDHGKKKETVTIVQCQWWEKRTFYKVLDPFTGELKTVDEASYQSLGPKLKKMGMPPMQAVKLRRKVFRQAFIGRTILKVADSPCPTNFTFNFITGFRDRNKGQYYGLVRGMKDPQRWANKWLSQTLHIMNSSAKGGVLAEEGITEDWRQFQESFAKTEQVTKVENGALAGPNGPRIQPKPVATFPQGFFGLMEFAISSIRDVAGINLEMLGMREAGQAASLEYQRRQAGITILASLFKAMRRYHRNQGKVMLYFIQNHLSNGQLIKIVGNEGAKYVPLVKQADKKYDIIVDEGPTSPNQKERVWQLVGPSFWKLPPPIQIELLDYSPFPESVVQRITKASKAMSEGPQAEMQQKMMQIEAQLKQIEGALKQAQTAKTQAETQKIASEIGRPDAPGGDPRLEHQTKMIELQAKTETDRQGQIIDLQKQREKNSTDMQIEQAWMSQDAQVSREDREMKLLADLFTTALQPKPDPARAAKQ